MSERIIISANGIAISKPGKQASSTTASDFLINTAMSVFISSMLSRTLVTSLNLVSFVSPSPAHSGSNWLSNITAVYSLTIPHNLGYVPSFFTSMPVGVTNAEGAYNTPSYSYAVTADATNIYINCSNYNYSMQSSSSYTAPGAGSPQIPSPLPITPFSVTINTERWI